MVKEVSYRTLMGQSGGPGSLRDTAEMSSYSGVVVGQTRAPDPCGFIHRLYDRAPGERYVDWPLESRGGPYLWRVERHVAARLSAHSPLERIVDVTLEPGTLLRHDQTDEIRDGGCAMFEWYWERFAVMSGLHQGVCVEFEPTFPRTDVVPAMGEFPGPAEIIAAWSAPRPPTPTLGKRVGRRRWLGLRQPASTRVEPDEVGFLWDQIASEPDPGYTPGQRVEWKPGENIRGASFYPLHRGLADPSFSGPPTRIWRVGDVEVRGHYGSALFYSAFTVLGEVPVADWYGGEAIVGLLARVRTLTAKEVGRSPAGLPSIEPRGVFARRVLALLASELAKRAANVDRDAASGRPTSSIGDAERLDAAWWSWARARHASFLAADAILRRDELSTAEVSERLRPWHSVIAT